MLMSDVPVFADAGQLRSGWAAAVAWIDYDGDADLDAFLGSGYAGRAPQLYRNDPGGFAAVEFGISGIDVASGDWGDFDRDGDLDLLYWGEHGSSGNRVPPRILRNNGGTWSMMETGARSVGLANVSWADYDADGDLDFLLTGWAGSGSITRFYRLDAQGFFTETDPGIAGVSDGESKWADYDADGDLDLLVVGRDGGTNRVLLYRNQAGSMQSASAGLPQLAYANADWGDYDQDGDLDLLLTGATSAGSAIGARIYRNDGGAFVLGHTFDSVPYSVCRWADYDGDGDLDATLSGAVYRNDDGGFTRAPNTGFPGAMGRFAWGDYDHDGDLDLLANDYSIPSNAKVVLRRNEMDVPDTAPAAPGGLTQSRIGPVTTLSWAHASDDRTPVEGLTYSLRMGTSPGAADVIYPAADLLTGFRRAARSGAATDNSWNLRLPQGTYYWSVQAIDSVYGGSAWLQEHSFSVFGPTVQIGNAQVVEGDGGTQMQFGVALSWSLPVDMTIDFTTSDGTATAGADYVHTAGTLTIPAGATAATISVPVLGDFDEEQDETFELVLSNASGAQIGGRGRGTGTILNEDPLTVSISNASIIERDGRESLAVFTVNASRASDVPWSVDFATSDGTAVAGSDYQSGSGVLTFSPGMATQTISVPVFGDFEEEGDETFAVLLTNSTGAVIAAQGRGNGVIIDDDPITVSIGDVSIVEGDAGQPLAVFTVTASRGSHTPWAADFATSDSTAVAGIDYEAMAGTLSFAPGSTTQTVSVPIIGELEAENDEQFVLTITPSTGPQVNGGATATILDDDAPVLSLGAVAVEEGDAGQRTASLIVTVFKPSGQPIVVQYRSEPAPHDSATAGEDYLHVEGSLTIPAGQISGQIQVPVLGDGQVEADEQVQVTIHSPTNAVIRDAGTALVIIHDDDAPATPLPESGFVHTELEPGRSHRYSIQVRRRRWYELTLRGPEAETTPASPTLELFDASGHLLATSEAREVRYATRGYEQRSFRWQAPVSGEFIVRVGAASGEPAGDYSLEVTRVRDGLSEVFAAVTAEGVLVIKLRHHAWVRVTEFDGGVRINGMHPDSGPLQASAVTGIVVYGGRGNNFIDLSGVRRSLSGFQGLDGRIAVFGRRGKDRLRGSSFGDGFDGGPGFDTLETDSTNDAIRAVEIVVYQGHRIRI